MTSPPPTTPSSADTAERLSDSLALITAAQAMLRGQLSAQVFAEQIQQISQQYAGAGDALTHMAMACAQVLRTASCTTPDVALSHTGVALAAFSHAHRTGLR